MNPRNVLDDLDSYDYDGYGKTGNVKCGDEMLFVIKVDRDKEIITDCKWKTYGCASAIATTSKLSEMVTGMPLEEAYRISPKDIVNELGGLPDNKIHCSVIGDKALRAAIEDYYSRNGMEDRIAREETNIICECMNVSESEIEEAVLEGARNFLRVQEMTKAGTVCGQCKDDVIEIMNKHIRQHFGNP
ncbi:MAG: iron-sulfur cluster assembly scaffold protein [Candidatus Latescibacteria bacterium]|nr:iron-sulfur cluster assembly scaffold protein [bacterium]MBD3423724.1 iron-sulfur cluster assembly scaffold protein [Candidatus Latescibacterota bacterium]